MKRQLMILLIVAVLATALCLTVAATDEASGFRDIGTAANLTIAPQTAEGAAVQDGSGVWAGSDRLTVTYTAAMSGKEYLVMLVSGSDLPTASDEILYIDQKTAEGTEVTFNVYPLLKGTEDMTLFITSNDGTTSLSVSLSYYSPKPAYVLGDVDGNSAINTVDASMALQYYVNASSNPLDETQQLAADVDGNGAVNTVDASMILQHYVGNCNEATCPLAH